MRTVPDTVPAELSTASALRCKRASDTSRENARGLPSNQSTTASAGALFRNEKRSVSKTNLMVFLRPYIIRDGGAGRSITLNRYEFMRRAQGGLQPERSWAMPDVQAPQLPSVEKAIPGAQQQQQGPRAVIRAVPVSGSGGRP